MSKLHIIPVDKFTTNILCVLVRRPLTREEATPTALLPSMLARGCEKYPTVQAIRLAAESLHGSIFDAQIIKKGEQQILQFFLECINGEDRGLDFLWNIISHPRVESKGFYAPYTAGEKDNLKSRIQGRVNNKSEYNKLKCLEAMCAKEPFGLYGDGYEEDLPAITPENLYSHYTSVLGNSPIDIIAFGKWDEPWLKEEIAAKFSPATNPLKIPKESLYPARLSREIIRLDYGTTQGNLCIGLRGEIDSVGMDFIHFQLVSEILGGSPSAKLFTKVREKESLCYSIYSTVYRFKSLMCIVAGTAPDKLEQVSQLSEDEFESLKKGNFTDNELHNAKQALSKRWRAMEDNPSASVDFYASQYLLGDNSTLEELLAMVEKASKEGVVRTASRLNIDTVVMMK